MKSDIFVEVEPTTQSLRNECEYVAKEENRNFICVIKVKRHVLMSSDRKENRYDFQLLQFKSIIITPGQLRYCVNGFETSKVTGSRHIVLFDDRNSKEITKYQLKYRSSTILLK